MSVPEHTSRREFLKYAAATGAMLSVNLTGCEAPGRREPSIEPVFTPKTDKVRLAFIGTGGIGNYHLESTEKMDIVCPCYTDVDTNRMGKAKELHPGATAYQDYREMFDKEKNNFDAVMIGIPDHSHYPATILAMQMGKHVYTQKPLTHTPWEARQLTEAAQKYKVATQMGNQGHAGEGWRLVYEYIHAGVLGDITKVHTWTDRPIWPQGIERPEETDPVPANLNWDAWIGPAPMRPFREKAYHWFNWRGWFDFGCGALGDMACHTMDGVFWALNPGAPTMIEPLCATPVNDETFPTSSVIRWTFPRRGSRREFVAYWYDGGLLPMRPAHLEYGRRIPGTGNLFIGTKASMLVSGDYGNSPRIIPETKMKEISEYLKKTTGDAKPPQLLERSPGHIDEWIMACKGEQPINFPKSNFAYSGPMSETILLGCVALRAGRMIEWDSANMRVTNVEEANQYVTKEYRDGWKF